MQFSMASQGRTGCHFLCFKTNTICFDFGMCISLFLAVMIILCTMNDTQMLKLGVFIFSNHVVLTIV